MEEFERNIGVLTKNEQKKLTHSKIGIVGLGGIGAPAFEILVRIGVGNFVLFDNDRFEKSNFNRQLYAIDKHLGSLKVEVAEMKAMMINPTLKIESHSKKLDEKTVNKLKGCDVVVDGVDNIASRKVIARFCRKNRIPYVFCAAGLSMGMCGVFTDADFDKVFAHAKEVERKSVIAPAAFLAGSISGMQAANVLLGKGFVKAPEFLFFDVFDRWIFWKRKI